METVTLSKNPMALNQGRLDLGNTVMTMVTVNDDDGETVTLLANDGVIIIISKDTVVSMVTDAMITIEGDVVCVC